jgi:hypothetical protein
VSGPSWLSAAAMAWELAGRPRRDGLDAQDAAGTCAVCGAAAGETVPAAATVGNGSFAGQELLTAPWSAVTCYPCAWALAGRPPRSLRNWTVACAPGRGLGPSHPGSAAAVPGEHPGLLLTARNDMRAVAGLLAAPPDGPWCAAVAESGHKHALPWTAVNHGAGRWLVSADTMVMAGEPGVYGMLLGRSAVLRQAGFTAAEITAGEPALTGRLQGAALAVWRAHTAYLASWRDSPLLRLANLMITKEHAGEYAARYCP